MHPRLTLACVTWENLGQLIPCLVSLVRNTDFDGRLIVVNNGKADGFEQAIRYSVPYDLEVLQMPENRGWCGGVNAALSKCDTEFFAMCNDDLIFPVNRHFWERTYHWLDWTHETKVTRVGGVGPTSNYIAGYQNINLHGMPDVHTAGLLIGMLATYRHDLLNYGLDESLPGGDDYDLSIRTLKNGYNLVVDRTLYVHHHGAQTGRRVHGAHWDSVEHQQATINAIVKKHSLKDYYGMLNFPIAELGGGWTTKAVSLNSLYRTAKTQPSDIHEHMETLRTFAASVNHVTEMGTHDGTSTTAFLHAQPDKLVCYDIKRQPEIDQLQRLAGRTDFVFHEKSTLDVEIEPTDLLFIDDLHTGTQVRAELDKHADKVRRYLLFHDTSTCAKNGEIPGSEGILPAIEDFLRSHPEWRTIHMVTFGNGLMGLARVA